MRYAFRETRPLRLHAPTRAIQCSCPCCLFHIHTTTKKKELKEACKSFEKVLVQNIQTGLSAPFTGAVKDIGRWRLVQAALPHVMHCCATLLHARVKDLQAIGTAETKLLYTLHWILLFAADECADEEIEAATGPKEKAAAQRRRHLFSVATVSLFVYLFAPIAHHLKESDFENFRLEQGLRLWQAMWEYRAPAVACFVAAVKPKARQVLVVAGEQTSSAASVVLSPTTREF